jgi:two-component system chemotaxis sensor kinase CheA
VNKRTLSDRLKATFLAELDQQLRVMNADLLALESNPADAARLRSLFRVAHSLKGAAGAAGVREIEEACHQLETMLLPARDGAMKLGQAQFDTLFAAADTLAETGRRLRAGDEPPATADTAAPRGNGRAVPVSAHAAVAAQPGTDDSGYLRIEQAKLDDLLASVEQLVVAIDAVSVRGSALTAAAERDTSLAKLASGLIADTRRLSRAGADVASSSHILRMRPFSDACEALPRVVRDLSSAMRKEIALDIRGGEVQADRAVLDGLRDAILHLVRNAVDHGAEPAAVRRAAGKPSRATITVAASLEGDQICVTVSDDGAGLDLPAIRAALQRLGRPVPAADQEVVAALFESGFSTRDESTTISGRGVGLDLARTAVERIRGTVDVAWEAGRGTRFTLRAPLTLITIRAVLVRVGPQLIAVPTAQIERVVRVAPDDVSRADGGDVLTIGSVGEAPVRLVSLARVLGPPLPERHLDSRAPALLLQGHGRRLAVLVDELVSEREVVVRNPEFGGFGVPHLSGAAIVGGARIALVLNPQSVVTAGLGLSGVTPLVRSDATGREAARRILVVDDSITTRTLEQSLLEAAGYVVSTAVDGVDAWARLQEEECDLVVADVEMPRMDGFALCRAIRGSSRLQRLPVVLVTALEAEEDRARGMEAGADAYLTKSSFDQRTLLDAIEQLLD